MSDTKSGDDKTLSVSPKKTLTLKPAGVTQGTVRQNFSHGRTKSVVVETKKRKFSMPGDKPEPAAGAGRGVSGTGAAGAGRRALGNGAQRAVEQRDGSPAPRARRLQGS